ncbi:AMP-binding protein, partial [Pseudoalteromonas holothuriae]|uniref:AMP-binding protein n=1 Tax=Pseudoalteromonas holothuriae TaxID=2963714 RepID=UPI0021C08F10
SVQCQEASSLKWLLAGGDVLNVEAVKQVQTQLPNVALINGYGPTENTTFTCCYQIPTVSSSAPIPIGKGVNGDRLLILDSNNNIVPIGVIGELHVGGDGLARGYLNNDALTNEKFIPNPFSTEPQSRLYKTGDLVRWLPDGSLAYIGRADNQVKIRGFRI